MQHRFERILKHVQRRSTQVFTCLEMPTQDIAFSVRSLFLVRRQRRRLPRSRTLACAHACLFICAGSTWDLKNAQAQNLQELLDGVHEHQAMIRTMQTYGGKDIRFQVLEVGSHMANNDTHLPLLLRWSLDVSADVLVVVAAFSVYGPIRSSTFASLKSCWRFGMFNKAPVRLSAAAAAAAAVLYLKYTHLYDD